jgi:16S rRNA (adenine1518-N6/adenine1519-N6)-dimethyltransferase
MSQGEEDEVFSSRRSMLNWTLSILRKYGFRPSKKKDQHFLVHPRVIQDVLNVIGNAVPEDCLEIGTGIGTLTLALSARFRRVVTVEIDPKLASIAKEVLPDNVLVIVGDGIAIARSFCVSPLISNTPYSISSALVASIARNNCIKEAILVVQKELAFRMKAPPGTPEYGRLSIITRRYFDVSLIKVYPKDYFYPPPLVDGALLHLRRIRPWKEGDEILERLTACLFSGRNKLARKMAKRCLGADESALSWLGEKRVKDLDQEDIEKLMRFPVSS